MSPSSGSHDEDLRRADIELVAEPQSVRTARDFVSTMLDVWSCDDLDRVVELLTSEIVTNAVRHARGTVTVEASLMGDGSLWVGASDDHPGGPILQGSDLLGESGRGMRLVQSLARRWGVVHEDGRKVVWFEAPVIQRRRSLGG